MSNLNNSYYFGYYSWPLSIIYHNLGGWGAFHVPTKLLTATNTPPPAPSLLWCAPLAVQCLSGRGGSSLVSLPARYRWGGVVAISWSIYTIGQETYRQGGGWLSDTHSVSTRKQDALHFTQVHPISCQHTHTPPTPLPQTHPCHSSYTNENRYKIIVYVPCTMYCTVSEEKSATSSKFGEVLSRFF